MKIVKRSVVLSQLNGDNLIVGLGLNQFIDINTKDVENAGGVFDKIELAQCPHELASDLYQFILTNKDNQITTIKDWELNCLHLNELVQIDEEKEILLGLENMVKLNSKHHRELNQLFQDHSFLSLER